MRPRKRDLDLPKRTYFRHGRFYYVEKKSGKWIPLSRNKQRAIHQALALTEGDHKRYASFRDIRKRDICHLTSCLENTYKQRKQHSSRKGIPFEITLGEIIQMADDQGWTCAVTGMPFEWEKSEEFRRNPMRPSIDRIQPALGYVPGNVRIITVVANTALNEYGDKIMTEVSAGWGRIMGNAQ